MVRLVGAGEWCCLDARYSILNARKRVSSEWLRYYRALRRVKWGWLYVVGWGTIGQCGLDRWVEG